MLGKKSKDTFPPRSISPGNTPLQGRNYVATPSEAKRIIESRLPRGKNFFDPDAVNPSAKSFTPTFGPAIPNIADMAAALGNDVDRIYWYVRNQIKFTPTFGVQKGAYACMIERYGNSFDQAALMVALLRAAGYQANFMQGELKLTATQADAWLGTTGANIWAARNLFANGSVPVDVIYDAPTTTYYVHFSHVWVKVLIGATWYYFDPSYKTHQTITGIDILSVSGYNATTFQNAAMSGATATADYVKDVNTAGIKSQLSSLSTTLSNWILANNPTATVDDILGGRKIIEDVTQVRNSTAVANQYTAVTPTEWTAIPNNYRTTLRVQYPGIDQTFYSDDIAGKRLTLFFNSSLEAELRLDGTLIATSTAQDIGTWDSVLFSVDHPYAYGWSDQSWYQQVWAGSSYLIANAWGATTNEMAYMHQKILQDNLTAGGADTDEHILGESLCTLWYNWMAQSYLMTDWNGRHTGCYTVLHHQVGMVGHGDGPFMDLGGVAWATSALDNVYDSRVQRTDQAISLRGIGFEGCVITQVPNVDAVCTTAVIETANQGGQKLYLADSTNWTSTVRPALTGYDTQVLDDLTTWYINAGWKLMIHENGATQRNLYHGYGVYAISPYGGIVGLINGYLQGSGPTEYLSAAAHNENASVQQTKVPSLDRTLIGKKFVEDVEFHVDGGSGRLNYQHTDYHVGAGAFPHGLPFIRYYNNDDVNNLTFTARGWRHNYQITVEPKNDAFGTINNDQSALLAAIQMLQSAIGIQLLTGGIGPTSLSLGSLSVTEANKLLTNNTVRMRTGDRTYVFVQLANGQYLSPKGVSIALSWNVDHYEALTTDGVKYIFWPHEKIRRMEFPNGVWINFAYNTDGIPNARLVTITNSLGRSISLEYDPPLNYLKKATFSDGVMVNYNVEPFATGNLLSATLSNGQYFTYSYDSKYRLTGYTLNSNSHTVTYDDLDRVTNMYNPGYSTQFLYGPRETRANGPKQILTSYNADGQPVQINVGGDITSMQYDGWGREIVRYTPNGDSIQTSYDIYNRVIAKNTNGLTESFSYTNNTPGNGAFAMWTGYTDPKSIGYSRTVDSAGNVTSWTGPTVGGQTPTKSWTFGSWGMPATFVDETGILTVYSCNNDELSSTVVDSGTGKKNLTTSHGYDSHGNRTSTTNPRGNTTTMSFDARRRMTGSISPAPFNFASSMTLDDAGNVLVQTKQAYISPQPPAYQTTSFGYNAANVMTGFTDPLNNSTGYTLDAAFRVIEVLDPELRKRKFTYTQDDHFASITDAANNLEEFRTFVSGSKIATDKDARNNQSSFGYDAKNRLNKITYPDSTYEEWTFDNNGNITNFRNRNAVNTVFTYDNLNRVLTKKAGTEPTVTYTYDLAGRMLTASTPVVAGNPSTGTFTYGYDSAGRLISETNPQSQVMSYELDANGNVTKITYPSGYYVVREYDQLDRLTGIKLNGATTYAAQFTYDALSRRITKTYGNGNSVTYGYDMGDNLTSRSMTVSGGTVNWTYTYNKVHQLLSQSVSDLTYQWRPTGTSTVNYGAANNKNQYPTVGGATYTYSNNGNLTGDGTWTFGYSVENMLTSASKTGTSASFVYDPFLRQTQKTVGSTKTKYNYSGSQLMEEYNGTTNALLRRYVYAGPNEPIIQMDAAGTLTYLHHDHLGSVIAQANAAGAVTNKYLYSPFGQSASLTGTTIGYTSQRYDSETGLYHYKARYYSAGINRFLQPDPIGYEAGMNLYAYVGNDPIDKTDPDGMEEMSSWERIFRSGEVTNSSGQTGKSLFTSLFGLSMTSATYLIPGGPKGAPGIGTGSAIGRAIARNFRGSNSSTYTVKPFKTIEVDFNKSPQAALHLRDNLAIPGNSNLGFVDRFGAQATRNARMKQLPKAGPGRDNDEALAATFRPLLPYKQQITVRPIPLGDNRSGGAQFGAQLRDVPNGVVVKLVPKNIPAGY